MAIPSRFLQPTPKKPIRKTVGAVSPTVVAVFLSVAAHGVFIAFGPRASFSFAALTEAAQLQDAEESIVPIVELTPADRNRLPAFAQPRPTPTPLNSLPLPAGLPGLAGTTQKRNNLPTPSRNLPSPTPRNQRSRSNPPFRTTTRTTTLNPSSGFRFGAPRRNPRPAPPVELVSPPPTPNPSNTTPTGDNELPDLSGLSTSSAGIQLGDQFPSAPGTRPAEGESSQPSANDLLSREIAAAQAEGNIPAVPGSESGPQPDTNLGGDDPTPIAVVEAPTAPAQGNASRLARSFEYSGEDTEPAAVEANVESWLDANAESKSESGPSSDELSIDSNFKVCLDNPPEEGLIGVVVNPDGTQTSATILKSTGYDILNRLALSTLEYKEFEQTEQPTQYQVAVDVVYEPEDCVEELPETE